MSQNFGPAGIFSTDDPEADQRQIECEEFDDQEDYDADDPYADFDIDDLEFDFNYPRQANYTCRCSNSETLEKCNFFNYKLDSTTADRQAFEEESRTLHFKLHPHCKGKLIIQEFEM